MERVVRFRFSLRNLFIAITAISICLFVGIATAEYLSYRNVINHSEAWIAEILASDRFKGEKLVELEMCRSILIATPRLTEEDRSRLIDRVHQAKARVSTLPEPVFERDCYSRTIAEAEESDVEGR